MIALGISIACLLYAGLAYGTQRTYPHASAPSRTAEPAHFWLQVCTVVFLGLAIAANLQALDSGASRGLQLLQHSALTAWALSYGILAPKMIQHARQTGQLKGVLTGFFSLDTALGYHERHWGVTLLVGGLGLGALVIGFWAPIVVLGW